MSDIEFVQGLIVKRNEKAPDFLICSLSIKRDELIQWLQDRDGDWVNVDIKNSKAGKLYAAVNNFKPKDDRPQKQTRGEKVSGAKHNGGGVGTDLDSDPPF